MTVSERCSALQYVEVCNIEAIVMQHEFCSVL